MSGKQKTIGGVIHPEWNYDLESSLRVHRELVNRSLATNWRFPNRWVTTGPLETLMGYPGCGCSSGSTSALHLELRFKDGLEHLVKKVNGLILRALCEYPKLANLSETIRGEFIHCCHAVDDLGRFELGKTHEQLNSHWKKANLLRDVRLECCDTGVYLNADVSFNNKPCESRWGLFWLAKQTMPKWNERLRLKTWLGDARLKLETLASPRAER